LGSESKYPNLMFLICIKSLAKSYTW